MKIRWGVYNSLVTWLNFSLRLMFCIYHGWFLWLITQNSKVIPLNFRDFNLVGAWPILQVQPKDLYSKIDRLLGYMNAHFLWLKVVYSIVLFRFYLQVSLFLLDLDRWCISSSSLSSLLYCPIQQKKSLLNPNTHDCTEPLFCCFLLRHVEYETVKNFLTSVWINLLRFMWGLKGLTQLNEH